MKDPKKVEEAGRPETDAEAENASRRVDKPEISPAVIRRLPRYFRYLRVLIREGKMRISSAELSRRLHVTASQIRQDLNCFGGFGQQGYGYNVQYLYENICEILGVNAGFTAVIIGAGDLGRALVRSPMFSKRGIEILAMFDVDPVLIGKTVGGIRIHDMCELEDFCRERAVDMAVLTLPKDAAQVVAERVSDLGVPGLWNFTGQELALGERGVTVENVHLGDSLMILSYELGARRIAAAGSAADTDVDGNDGTEEEKDSEK